jgi:hypothetical protein
VVYERLFTYDHHPVRPQGISTQEASLQESTARSSASAASHLEEFLPRAECWDTPVSGQTAETASARVPEFFGSAEF